MTRCPNGSPTSRRSTAREGQVARIDVSLDSFYVSMGWTSKPVSDCRDAREAGLAGEV